MEDHIRKNCPAKHLVLVLNKVDRVADPSIIDVLRRHYDDTVTISAATGDGIDKLAAVVSERLSGGYVDIQVEASVANGKLFAWLTRHAQELSRTYTDETSARVQIICRIPRQAIASIPSGDVIVTEPAVAAT